jgi:predicted nucleotidyltransferase
MKVENTIVNQIRKVINPIAIVLFGSRASGKYGLTSDWDILVIVPILPDYEKKIEIEAQISDPLIFEGIFVSPILMLPEDFDKGIDSLDPLFPEIHKHSKILFGEEWLKSRLRKLEISMKSHKATYIPELRVWRTRNA